jgi:hypothetical protein
MLIEIFKSVENQCIIKTSPIKFNFREPNLPFHSDSFTTISANHSKYNSDRRFETVFMFQNSCSLPFIYFRRILIDLIYFYKPIL